MRTVSRRGASPGLVLAPVNAIAQESDYIRPEIRMFAGAFLPRGSAGRYTEVTLGVQSAIELTDFAEGVVSVGWTTDHTSRAAAGSAGVSICQYDAGIEFNSMQPSDNGWIWRPFAGGGLGGRTLRRTRSPDVDISDQLWVRGLGRAGRRDCKPRGSARIPQPLQATPVRESRAAQ